MVKKIIIAIISVLIFTFVGCFIGINWKGLKTLMSGAQIYTKSQMVESYNQGYEDANTNEDTYETQIDYYKGIVEDNKLQIQNLNNSIVVLKENNETYKKQIAYLQETNSENEEIIKSLENLTSSNAAMIYDYETQITQLENQISNLEKSIAYYEKYIANLEQDTQVVATFEYNGSVYNLQVLNKGGYASVVDPEVTDYLIFNGWTVDGQIVDLTTYQINKNTRFVASLEYKYDVNFVVDDIVFETQLIASNSFASNPQIPVKDGYEFDGWSLDGFNIIDVTKHNILTNTTYYAVFTKLHTVTFKYEDETISTQMVRDNGFADNVIVDSTTYKVFKGWTIGEILVDVENYSVTADTIFFADITYKYDVLFTVDGITYDSQIITKNGCSSVPADPSKDGYIFSGWSIDGINVINVSNYGITNNTNFIAVFDVIKDGTFKATFKGEKDGSIVTLYSFTFVVENNKVISVKENTDFTLLSTISISNSTAISFKFKTSTLSSYIYMLYDENTSCWYVSSYSSTCTLRGSDASVVRL